MWNLLKNVVAKLPRSLTQPCARHFTQGAINCSKSRRLLFPHSQPTVTGGSVQSPGHADLGVNQYLTQKEGTVTGLSYKVTDQRAMGKELSTHSPSSSVDDEVEVVVGHVDDLQLGQIKEVEIGGQKALIVKEEDGIFAFGSRCTHYGAPLIKGAYCNGRIRCPWHGACFNVKIGDIEDYPGLDSIHTFKVQVVDDIVKVKVSQEKLKQFKRVKPMVKYSCETKQVYLLVGGGAASLTCAETLRQEGFFGKIILATKEDCVPYDRPKLSKALSSTAESIALRNKEFLAEHDIEVLTEKELTSLDTASSTATFKDGTTITYNSLLLATGGKPRNLEVPGSDLKNVCQLRTPSDANYIGAQSEGKNVVVVGNSFIGMEVAAAVVSKASSVTVVSRGELPFKAVFGTHLAQRILQLHQDKGVKFQFNCETKELQGSDGKLTCVVLSNGTELPADLCVVGIGVTPSTTYLKDTNLKMNSKGFINVDKHMKTNISGVYAAGDITEFPLFIQDNQVVNVQHWQMAHAQGRNAALNMLGKVHNFQSVPYFWTSMFGKSIRYAGYGAGYDDIVLHEEEQKIVAFYTKGDQVVAVASMNYDPIVSKVAEIMFGGKVLTKAEVAAKSNDWLFS